MFPTPWQVVLGIVELTQQDLLLQHVLVSLPWRACYSLLENGVSSSF